MKKDKKERTSNKRGIKGAFAKAFGRRRGERDAAAQDSLPGGFAEAPSDSIDDAMLYGRQAAFYGDTDDAVLSAPVSSPATDADLGDALASALKDIAGAGSESARETAGKAAAAPAIFAAVADSHTSGVSWNTDEELEALLRASSSQIEETAAEEIPEKVTAEDIAIAAFEARPEEIPPEFMTGDAADADNEEVAADNTAAGDETGVTEEPAEDKWAEFYEGLEDMFRTEQK